MFVPAMSSYRLFFSLITLLSVTTCKDSKKVSPCLVTSVERRDGNQTLLLRYNFTYADSKIADVKVFDSTDTLREEWKIEYNASGQISQYQYDLSYYFDHYSLKVSSVEYGSDGNPVRTTQVYTPDFGHNGTFNYALLSVCSSAANTSLGGTLFDTSENKIGRVPRFLRLFGDILSPPCKYNIIGGFTDSGIPYHGYSNKSQTSFTYEFNPNGYPDRIIRTVAVQTTSQTATTSTSTTDYYVFEYKCAL